MLTLYTGWQISSVISLIRYKFLLFKQSWLLWSLGIVIRIFSVMLKYVSSLILRTVLCRAIFVKKMCPDSL